ncbi:MAG: hypothetical protein IJ086_04040 [Clostridium sp.]|nr:hypothetical protein [Clostridium sp.]
MKILKENYDEKLNLISYGLNNSLYNRECFSKGDIERETIAWKEFSNVLDKLAELGVNFDKFVLPITDAFEIELDEVKLREVRMKNTSEIFPEDLNLEVECPLLENVHDWADGGCVHDVSRVKVINN